MLLVDVGTHIINIDHVLAFREDSDDLVVIYQGPSEADGDPFTLRLTGDEAQRMQAWLKRNAEGIRGTAPTGFEIGS